MNKKKKKTKPTPCHFLSRMQPCFADIALAKLLYAWLPSPCTLQEEEELAIYDTLYHRGKPATSRKIPAIRKSCLVL